MTELVGEMLMLTIVLILIAVFSSTASNFLPPPRDQSVTIMVDGPDNRTDPINYIDVCLYHKGGDWIKTSDLTVVISDDEKSTILKYRSDNESFRQEPDSQSFDLGDRIVIVHIPKASAPHEVQLVTPRAVIFSGEV